MKPARNADDRYGYRRDRQGLIRSNCISTGGEPDGSPLFCGHQLSRCQERCFATNGSTSMRPHFLFALPKRLHPQMRVGANRRKAALGRRQIAAPGEKKRALPRRVSRGSCRHESPCGYLPPLIRLAPNPDFDGDFLRVSPRGIKLSGGCRKASGIPPAAAARCVTPSGKAALGSAAKPHGDRVIFRIKKQRSVTLRCSCVVYLSASSFQREQATKWPSPTCCMEGQVFAHSSVA